MSFTPTLEEDTPPATPPRRQIEQDDVCCVCLEAMRYGARGAQRAVPIPTCNRHGMHLECMAQWRVEGASRQHLQCPLCQNGHQQHGQAGGWLPEHDEHLAALCIAENVPYQNDGVAPKRHKYKSGTTPSVPSPGMTRQSLQPPFISRFIVVHVLLQSGRAPTRSLLWTCRAERCLSALLPVAGIQASLTGTPPGHVRAVVPSLSWKSGERETPPLATPTTSSSPRDCSHDDGYIPAPAQEMCLQIYGGLTMSSELDRFTNGYRTREQAHPHPTDIPLKFPFQNPTQNQKGRRPPLPLLLRWQCHDKPGKASTAYPSKTSSRHRCPPYRRCRIFWWNQSKKP